MRRRRSVLRLDAAAQTLEICWSDNSPATTISVRRLDARPIATMTLEAQERHERRERVHRDD